MGKGGVRDKEIRLCRAMRVSKGDTGVEDVFRLGSSTQVCGSYGK